ncbi:MAG: DnaJ domain-containing protein [Pseudomonadota bacterium]|nr:hypothetical protein [Pseudomonadota bacterium]QKK04841.1 MAG: DnaJ domain-containing protein [Pseudomonadota bacterium]
MSQPSPYEILGVAKNATDDEIKKAKNKALMRHHEDRVNARIKRDGLEGTPEAVKLLTEARQQASLVNGAYEILKDPEKRQTFDEYGYEGLARQANGDDPSSSGGSDAFWDFGKASAEFGTETVEMSDDELFGDDLDQKSTRRDVRDVLKNARHTGTNPFKGNDTSLDDLLDEVRGKKPKKSPPKKEDKPAASKGSGSSLLGDLAGKASGVFSRAKDKAMETVDDLTHGDDDAPATTGNSELSGRLRDVINELVETDGKLSSMSLRTVVSELKSIADHIDGGAQNRKKQGFNR